MDDGYVLKSSVLNAIHNGDIDMGMVTLREYRLLQELSERIDRRIQRVPVADVAPIRHGRWLKSDIPHEKFVCSECGGACWYYDYEGDVARSRYCPNCGAKMDRRNDDD